MSQAEIERAMRENGGDEPPTGEGIGLRNVIRRVSLATDGRGRVELESEPGRGTTVRIRLPAEGAAR